MNEVYVVAVALRDWRGNAVLAVQFRLTAYLLDGCSATIISRKIMVNYRESLPSKISNVDCSELTLNCSFCLPMYEL